MQYQSDGHGRRAYVKVRADHEIGGRVVPLMFRGEEGGSVRIDRILDVRPAASTRSGGQGMRYLCRVFGGEVYLYHDRDDWFVEVKAT
ncbi:MAG: hypothetical protein GX558_09720 [Clostridiales bacterium]|nr:hypothetical protein [Clostridiales bacterium]